MLAVLLGIFLLSLMGTGWYRHYALTHHILDIPNARSAHNKPIPRGGGIIFVGWFLSAMIYYCSSPLLIILVALGVALVGYVDDKKSLSAWQRLSCHAILSLTAVCTLGGMPDVMIGHWLVHFGFFTSIFGVLYLVWLLNLYNFMDGIDGLAALEAICAALGMAVLYTLMGCHDLIFAPLLLVAVVAGFLFWNFPKAKIFMGDAGSGFLGFLLGYWSLESATVHPTLFWSWLILLGVFMVDSTVTLVWRIIKGEPWYQGHSSHAYQHASRRYQSHPPVTLGIVALNLFWLWPLSMLVGLGHLNGLLGLIIAYLPLIMISLYFKFP